MGRNSRWWAKPDRGQTVRRSRPLNLETLEQRTTPATLLTPGLLETAADADTAEELIAISGNGKAILFASKASNLVPGVTDNNSDFDLFWRDLETNTTKLITAQAGTLNAIGFGTGGTAIPLAMRGVISHSGQQVAFVSAAPAASVTGDPTVQDQLNTNDIFWWDASTGATKLASLRHGINAAVGNQVGIEALDPNISDNGNFVAYGSNLNGASIDTSVALDNGNLTYDIFVRAMDGTDPTKSSTAATRIPGKADLIGKYGPVDRPVGRYLSGDGLYVVFSTSVGADIITEQPDLPNSPDVFIRDLSNFDETSVALLSVATNKNPIGNVSTQFAQSPIISRGGSAVVFVAKALGGGEDKQLVSGYTSNGAPTELYVYFTPFNDTTATRLITAVNGTTSLGANGFLEQPVAGNPASYQVSADGNFVTFVSAATNLVNSALDVNGIGLDVFLRNTTVGSTEYISVGKDGKTGSTPSDRPALSDDGRYVVFISSAPELGLGIVDVNGVTDAFLRDRQEGFTRAISTNSSGQTTPDGPTASVRIAAEGNYAAFVSRGKNLVTPSLKATVANLYGVELPLAPLFGGGSKLLLTSGPLDGQLRTFTIGDDSKLSPQDSPFIPFVGATSAPRVAVGDVNGDGAADWVVVSGSGGGSQLRVVDGLSGGDVVPAIATFEPSYTGGLFVAVADLTGDGKAEIIVSPDVGGGARIQIFSYNGTALTLVANFFGIDDPNFRGGARVAAGDLDGDGLPEVVVGAGFGGGPRVATYAGKTILSGSLGSTPPKLFGDFFAFPGTDAATLRNGVFVATGDINGDGKADMIFGGGPGGGPRVFALDSALLTAKALDSAYAAPLANFFAFDSNLRGGVRVAAKDLDGDELTDIIVGSGDNNPAQIRSYRSADLPAGGTGDIAAFQVIDPFGGAETPGGIFVG